MINTSAEYKNAVTATIRRAYVRAVVDLISPDIVYGVGSTSGEAKMSQIDQLYNKTFQRVKPWATLEQNIWLLDGTRAIAPVSGYEAFETGYVSDVISGADGTFTTQPWVEMQFSNVSVLQAMSVYFPQRAVFGWPVDFTIEIKKSGVAQYTQTFTNNTQEYIEITGFTVNNPDAIRVTVSKWSLPYERMRVVEILAGVYEQWESDKLSDFTVNQLANFAGTALPYGTCSLGVLNTDKRFDPRNKSGLFKSLEERQGIATFIGIELAESVEWIPTGVYYQFSGGWKTGNNDLTVNWQLVDIVGLLTARKYVVPATLPTTLGGWIASIVSQLGVNFDNRYTIASGYESTSATVPSAAAVANKTCGDVLRFVCMATGTYARADNATGNLLVEPLGNDGTSVTLGNVIAYPVIGANDDLANIVFTFADDTQYVVAGTSESSANTLLINNPFINSAAQANAAAAIILATYGGNHLTTIGRGDPATEIGDIDSIEVDKNLYATGRRVSQSFVFSEGVLQSCQSEFIQPNEEFTEVAQ